MRLTNKSDVTESCAFIRPHFLGPQRDIAFTLATALEDCFVGERITALLPETDLRELLDLSGPDFERAILSILPIARLDALGRPELVKALEEQHARNFMLRLQSIVTFRDLVRLAQDIALTQGD